MSVKLTILADNSGGSHRQKGKDAWLSSQPFVARTNRFAKSLKTVRHWK